MKRFLLLTGVIIVSTLITILIFSPPYFRGTKERVCRMSCAGQLVSLGFSLRMYSNVYKGEYPPYDDAKGLDLLRSEGFCGNIRAYVCPSVEKEIPNSGVLTESISSYNYFGGHSESDSPYTIIMCDKTDNHKSYRNILLLDGSVGILSEGRFKRFIKFENVYVETDTVIPEEELKKLE
jgi:prepilin-type processing-associated H-X9-DG protein